MYICICNGLNEAAVKKAIEHGARTPGQVFRHYKCGAQCQKCVPEIKDLILSFALERFEKATEQKGKL